MKNLMARTYEKGLYCRPILSGLADVSNNENWIHVDQSQKCFVLGKHDIHLEQYKDFNLKEILLRRSHKDEFYWWFTNASIIEMCQVSRIKNVMAPAIVVAFVAAVISLVAHFSVGLKALPIALVVAGMIVFSLVFSVALRIFSEWTSVPYKREARATVLSCMLHGCKSPGFMRYTQEVGRLQKELFFTGKIRGVVLMPVGAKTPIWVSRREYEKMEVTEF